MKTFLAVLLLVVLAFQGAKAILNCSALVPLADGTLTLASLLLPPKECNATEDNVTFYYLYRNTSRTFKIGETPFLDNISSNCCLRVFCHGWMPLPDPTIDVIRPWVDIGCGVIYVEWKYYAATLNYLDAKECVVSVGLLVAKLLETIPVQYRESCLHCVGYSLGAHIIGIASMKIQPKLKFITALDAPILTDENATLIPVGKDSADCVQMIRTSVLSCNYMDAHAIFLMNGGSNQPGCLLRVLCDHRRSYKYFFESIKSAKKFIGTACNSTEAYKRGECSNNNKAAVTDTYDERLCSSPAIYYVETNFFPPYAKG